MKQPIPPEISNWFVALHHTVNRGEYATHVERVEQWFQSNINNIRRRCAADWQIVGFAPTNEQAVEIAHSFGLMLDKTEREEAELN